MESEHTLSVVTVRTGGLRRPSSRTRTRQERVRRRALREQVHGVHERLGPERDERRIHGLRAEEICRTSLPPIHRRPRITILGDFFCLGFGICRMGRSRLVIPSTARLWIRWAIRVLGETITLVGFMSVSSVSVVLPSFEKHEWLIGRSVGFYCSLVVGDVVLRASFDGHDRRAHGRE